MWDDAYVIYGPQTIVMIVMAMEYDHPIATNCDLVFVEMSGATMIIYDAN